MNKALKEYIEAMLSCIDDCNTASNGKKTNDTLFQQLIGVRVTLATMGINLNLEINPYYYKDGKPSTYTLEFAND